MGGAPSAAEPTDRLYLLDAVRRFAHGARTVAGVGRIALIGSLLTTKENPKDADVLVTVTEAVDMRALAAWGRKLKGAAQQRNLGADVFLADQAGQYIGRTCSYRACRPRRACAGRSCATGRWVCDDLQVLTLDPQLLAAPPLEIWPAIVVRTALPRDVLSLVGLPWEERREARTMEQVDVQAFWKLLRPEVVVWAVAEHAGQRSICPLGWTMRTSGTPPMMAISVAPSRYTHALIEAAGAFVLAYPGRELAQATLFCGTNSGRDTDKFTQAGVTALPAGQVQAPVIPECVANLECRLVEQFTTGDHTVFVAEVLAAWVHARPGPLLCLVDVSAGYETLLVEEGKYRFGVVRE